LKKINPTLLDRLFLFVNIKEPISVDQEREMQEKIARFISDVYECKKFLSESVLTINAKHALFSQIVLSGKDDSHQQEVFDAIAYGPHGDRNLLPREEAAIIVLEKSGFPNVDGKLRDFFFKEVWNDSTFWNSRRP
jgi:hypothetical protein